MYRGRAFAFARVVVTHTRNSIYSIHIIANHVLGLLPLFDGIRIVVQTPPVGRELVESRGDKSTRPPTTTRLRPTHDHTIPVWGTTFFVVLCKRQMDAKRNYEHRLCDCVAGVYRLSVG